MVWKRTSGNGGVLENSDGVLRSAILDDGVLQFYTSFPDTCDQEIANDHRMRDCVISHHRRHVAGAISDRRAFISHETSAVYLEFLSAAARRNLDHNLNVCCDGAFVHTVLKGCS